MRLTPSRVATTDAARATPPANTTILTTTVLPTTVFTTTGTTGRGAAWPVVGGGTQDVGIERQCNRGLISFELDVSQGEQRRQPRLQLGFGFGFGLGSGLGLGLGSGVGSGVG